MKKSYRTLRMPQDVMENLNKKKSVTENILKEELRNPNYRVKFTDFMRFFSRKSTYFYNDEVVKFFIKTKKNKIGNSIWA